MVRIFLLMVEGWLGPDNFEKGLRQYLADHRLGNATTKDLEAALKAAVHDELSMEPEKDRVPVLDAFLNTTGVPAIKGSFSATFRFRVPSLRSASQTVPMPPRPRMRNKR